MLYDSIVDSNCNELKTKDSVISGTIPVYSRARTAREEDRARVKSAQDNPHPDNMGVSFPLHVDYLTVTTWGASWADIYDECIFPYLDTELVDQGHGGRFYNGTLKTSLGVVVRIMPIDGDDRWTLELPGKACQLMGYEGLSNLYQTLARTSQKFKINRCDLAVDNCPFTPLEVYEAINANKIRTKTHREGLGFRVNPLELDEQGGLGTQTTTFGSRNSERYLRVYNKHGYTRFEVEYKDDWADRLGADLFIDGTPWVTAIGYIRDFVDFLDESIEKLREENKRVDTNEHLVDWWAELVNGTGRAGVKLGKTARVITIENIMAWLEKQVASAYSVCVDYGHIPVEVLNQRLMVIGAERRERSNTYKPLMHL